MSRRAVAIALDLLAVAIGILAAGIVGLDGVVVRIRPAGIRMSASSPWRALALLVGVVLVRLLLTRSGPFGVPSSFWRRRLRLPVGADPLHTPAAPGLWRRLAFASFGLALTLAILLHHQLWYPYSVADYGDPLFSMWRIGWDLHQLLADPAHLFDTNIFHPQPLTLAFSDPIILPALMAAPLLALGIHPVVAYNLVLLAGFWFSGIATYVLVERLTASPSAAFIAALIYATYSYRFDHFAHLELQMTQWMPFGLLALHLFVSTGRWPYAIALGLAGVAQLYSSMYYAIFFLVYASAIGAGLLLAFRSPVRRLVFPAIAVALLAGLIALPMARAFAGAQQAKGERPLEEIAHYSAAPSDYLRTNKYNAVWQRWMLPPEPERALFPGAVPLALGIIGLTPPLSAIRLVYAAGLLVSVEGSLGFNGTLYPLLHRWVPLVRGIRVPARFGALVGLTLSILAGFGTLRILQGRRSPLRRKVVLAALMAAVVIDAWPTLTLVPVWREPPAIYQTLKASPGAVLAEFPVESNAAFNIPYMYFSMWHWTPMVNGYSGFIPASYDELAPALLAFPRGNSIAALRRRGVTHVTVNCGLKYPDCEQTRNLMRQSADLRLLVETRWQGEPTELFELVGR